MMQGQAYGSVLRDTQGLWRMWYLDDPIYSEHYATSTDGIHWDKPDLQLGLTSRDGPVQSNAIMVSPQRDAAGRWLSGLMGPEGFCVLDAQQTPHPAAKARFTAMYLASFPEGEMAGGRRGLCIAWSDDGVTWTADEHNPVIPGWLDTGNVFFYDPKIKRYVVYGRPNAHVDVVTHANRLVARCESEDLVHWSPFHTVLDVDDLDAPAGSFVNEAVLIAGGDISAAKQAAAWARITEGGTASEKPLIRGRNRQWYGLTVFPYPNPSVVDSLYVGLGWMYDVPSGHIWMELLHSHDGIDWRRETGRRPWLGQDASRWDYPMVYSAASPPVHVGDELWVYYSATAKIHHRPGFPRDPSQPLRSIGACKLKEDRWVGYVAGLQEAEMVTQVIPRAAKLTINASVGPEGFVKVEVCDRYAKALPGHELARSIAVTGDGLSLPVRWEGVPDGQPLPETDELRLRIIARQATIHAVGLWS